MRRQLLYKIIGIISIANSMLTIIFVASFAAVRLLLLNPVLQYLASFIW